MHNDPRLPIMVNRAAYERGQGYDRRQIILADGKTWRAPAHVAALLAAKQRAAEGICFAVELVLMMSIVFMGTVGLLSLAGPLWTLLATLGLM